MDALYLYLTGNGYLAGIKAMLVEDDHHDHGVLSIPIYMLCGYVIELYMKAYLVHAGMTYEQVGKYRHNLKRLLSECDSRGLAMSRRLRSVILGMSNAHETHKFRYMTEFGRIYLPDIDAMVVSLNEWDSELAEIIFQDT